ncbi:MAG: protease pro-enzyme activation domain-containing protein [Streptosporangiaceae bacterium]
MDPGERLSVSVEVRRRPDAPPLPDLAVLGAQRPRDRARIDRGAVAESYGADPDDLAKVTEFASEYGLAVEESSAPRRTVRLSGAVAQMSKAFGVQLNRYQYSGGTYRSREGDVQVPRRLADIIKRVSGFTDRPVARPHLLTRPQVVSSFNAAQIGQMYNFPTGVDGAGVCIGIIELGGGYSEQDLNTYFGAIGLATPNVVAVSVDGAANGYEDGSGADGEVELDIEVSGSIAPGATIAVYFAPNTGQGFIDAITTATNDTVNHPAVLSISWGAAEDGPVWTANDLAGMDSAFADAAYAGITVLAAAGDNGSNDDMYDGQAHCDFPASDPNVIACGGTTLQVNTNETIDEIVWNIPFSGWATGGGISDEFGLPSWQEGKGVPPSVNNGVTIGRGVPDVAADADPNTGYDVVIDGSWTVEGGTSAVAPLYAGLFALIDESLGFPVGFVTPYLYSLYQTAAFLDITQGTNEVPPAPGYSASAGWDACSGLGRINGNNLLTELTS